MSRILLLLLSVVLATHAFAQSPDATPAPAADAASAEAVVQASGETSASRCAVGGTIEYTLRITWTTPRGRNVILKPFETPQAQGLDMIRQTQNSSRKFLGGRDITTLLNHVEYKCVEPGEHQLGPVSIPYQFSGSSQSDMTTEAEAVTVVVRPRLITRVREMGKWRYALFAAGLILFWIVVLLVRRRKKRELNVTAAVQQAQERDARGVSAWDELTEDARYTIDGEFFARLEDLLWSELFDPETPPAGTAATRIAILSGSGMPVEDLNELRKAINSCQTARYTSGVSQGDAQAVLALAKRIVERYQSRAR